MKDTAALTQFFSSISLLAQLDRGLIEWLAQASLERIVPRGTVLFFQGDVSNDLYFVRSGSVTLSFTNPDGRELVVNELRSGSFFGELGLITQRPRSLSAVAREKSELSIISRATFVELLDRDPTFARNLLQVVSQRLYVSTEREHALAFMDAPARLARLLLQYDEQASERGYITVSQEELARRTGLTRQTVAKILGRWRRLGWLLTGRGKIVLLNLKAIQSSEQ